MENKTKSVVVKVITSIAAIMIDAFLLFMMFLYTAISPYKYEWDETIKQVDPDKVIFLLLIWPLIGTMIIVATILKNKTNIHVFKHEKANAISLAFGGVLLAYCVIYIIWLSGMYQG